MSERKAIPSPFKPYERALTNLLKGNILRGVTVGNESTDITGELGKLGKFKQCKWRLVPTLAALREYNAEEALRESDNEDEAENEAENENGAWANSVREQRDVLGVEITFNYDRGVAGYIAYIVGLSQKDLGEFIHLPLVLTRLPKPLMKVLFEYLETAFDTLVLPMGVSNNSREVGEGEGVEEPGTGWLEAMLEMYVDVTKKTLNKDITLSYKVPEVQSGAVKMITMGLDKGDIPGFLNYGMSLKKLLGTLKRKRREEEEGEGNAGNMKTKGPLMLAVEKHMYSTMALNASKLVLVKVACGGFVVGGGTDGDVESAAGLSGRVKLFVPRAGHVRVGDDEGEGEDEEADGDGRNPEEVAAEIFLASLVQLALRKGTIASSKITGDEGIDASNKKKTKLTTGRIPRGRVGNR